MESAQAYAMNEFSDEARQRTELFESLAKKDEFTILPGRYGGEYNNDMLAVREVDGKTLLVLGLKVTCQSGDLQLDMMSMGPHRQFSSEWIDTVIYSLSRTEDGQRFAKMLATAKAASALTMGILFLDKIDQQVKLVAIAEEADTEESV